MAKTHHEVQDHFGPFNSSFSKSFLWISNWKIRDLYGFLYFNIIMTSIIFYCYFDIAFFLEFLQYFSWDYEQKYFLGRRSFIFISLVIKIITRILYGIDKAIYTSCQDKNCCLQCFLEYLEGLCKSSRQYTMFAYRRILPNSTCQF